MNVEQQLESIQNDIAHIEMNNHKINRENAKISTEINNLDNSLAENVKLTINNFRKLT